MRDGIICHFNLFDYRQEILEVKDDKITSIGRIETSEVSKLISEYCLKNNINYIHLYGDNSFLKRTIKDIDKYTKNLYSEKKIEIEVN